MTTLYNSEPFVREFHARASAVAAALTPDYEIIFVNDGSPDASVQAAERLTGEDRHVKVVDLSRNFGHHAAAYAAIEAASGRRVFLIDSDLEESPEWLVDFDRAMRQHGADVVFGVQGERRSGPARRAAGLFYRMFNVLSDTPIPADVCTVRLMTREYVDALLQLRDRNLFMAGLFAWAGFHQVALPVDKAPRRAGKSNYTARRMFALLVDAVTSFSPRPLYAAFFLGLALSAAAGALGVAMLLRKLIFPETVLMGYASLITSIFFVGGLTILFLGVIGIYLSKVFVEVKDRPVYVTRRRIGFDSGERK